MPQSYYSEGDINLTPAVAPPPVAAGVPTFEATEGDVAAIALAARSSAVLLQDALRSLAGAEGALGRALAALSCVGVDDPARANVDRVFVDVTRVKNGLAGVAEELQNLGVLS